MPCALVGTPREDDDLNAAIGEVVGENTAEGPGAACDDDSPRAGT